MGPKRIIVVEDEVLIADNISNNLKEMGYKVAGIAHDKEAALKLLATKEADLVLIDIRLDGENDGILLAEHIRRHYSIPFVFLTSHLDTSTLTSAKHTQPAGYITKPFSADTLYTTIEVALHNALDVTKDEAHIYFRNGFESEKILVKNILYLESDHVYVYIVTPERKIITRLTLKELLTTLPSNFIQVHKSFIVNSLYISTIAVNTVKIAQHIIPVSRTYKDNIVKK